MKKKERRSKSVNVAYEREQDRCYIVINNEIESYQVKMVSKNRPAGFLPMNVRKENGKQLFYYDIAEKETLETILEIQKINLNEIKEIIKAIKKAYDMCENYLLSTEFIWLSPEYIYKDLATNNFEFLFAFAPEKQKRHPLSLFIEKMLSYMDSEKYLEIGLLYSAYQESLGNNFTLNRLIAIMGIDYTTGLPMVCETPTIYDEHVEKWINENGNRKKEVVENKKQSKAGLFSRGLKKAYTQPKRKEESVIERAKEEEELAHKNINALEVENGHYLVALFENGAQNKIRISHFPFYIGSDPKQCDCVLPYEEVSARHLKLETNGINVFASDLGSKYGTKCNDNTINGKGIIPLKENDKIEIGRYGFRLFSLMK